MKLSHDAVNTVHDPTFTQTYQTHTDTSQVPKMQILKQALKSSNSIFLPFIIFFFFLASTGLQ